MKRQKYYAVHNGRNGTGIYTTWEETKANRCDSQSFRSLPEARAWLLGVADAAAADVAPAYTDPGAPSQQPSTSQLEPPTQQGASQIPLSRVKQEEIEEWEIRAASQQDVSMEDAARNPPRWRQSPHKNNE
ncbi:hypothetical protein BC628DRAFT_106500 [Trametes gibbosa]|nr:hypothetical protein BC628DRAFT_106500 [Trametes gibbosa]